MRELSRRAFLPSNSPLGATLHKARVVGDAGIVAVVAFFDMAAEGRGTAGLDGAHDARLRQRQGMCRTVSFAMLVSGLPVGVCSANMSKNVGHFESGWWHRRATLAAAADCSCGPLYSSGRPVPVHRVDWRYRR
jgi:hypothetical protein